MELAPEPVDRDTNTPFLLKLYYRTGAFHRPDEFSSPVDLPPHIALHTWPSATLLELTQLIAATSPALLPSPAIGTRLAFRHLYHDVRGPPASASTPRLATQDLGSVVIGDGGPGVATDPDELDMGRLKETATVGSSVEAAKTLGDARFVVGDILSVAILPPSAVDGSVASASAARMGRGYGVGSGQASLGPTMEADGRGSGRDRGFGDLRGGGYGGRMTGVGGRFERDGRDGRAPVPPLGEWRRGERLPDAPSMRGRGRGRPRW
ncbi:hypothetical protein N0V82_001008 [Gnomoniopsis sp. IMI 355080]|nr:hypothetical protein N0V82_001008 [Gnomoniopsis sp. IMI 355080]